MQDGASSHTAAETLRDFAKRGIRVIFWPLYSPNLNPIKMVWDNMKNWI